MSKSFTPGPWWVESKANDHALFVDNAYRSICQMTGLVNDERKANARLIAKAPEMYDILTRFTAAKHIWDIDELVIDAAALIKEIDGE